MLCVLEDRKGNGTWQVLMAHPGELCLANTQFTQREASRILQRATLPLSWNRPLVIVHRIPLPAPITTGRRRNETGCHDNVLSCAEQ